MPALDALAAAAAPYTRLWRAASAFYERLPDWTDGPLP